jgi:GntR family phosphonate transport system transcriptional regulator
MQSSSSRSGTGYSAWRLIAEELHAEIAAGSLGLGARLPTEQDLSERFGVNRHTARQAVASLAEQGLVESRRGSGTFVIGNPVVVHRIGMRTRLSSSLSGSSRSSSGRVLASGTESAPRDVVERLKLSTDLAVRVETLRVVDGRPLSVGTHWFDAQRLPDIATALHRTGSVTAALRSNGVADYLRASTAVSARHATAVEAGNLDLEPGGIVLVARALDTLPDGTPLQYAITRFSAARVVLDIEQPDSVT